MSAVALLAFVVPAVLLVLQFGLCLQSAALASAVGYLAMVVGPLMAGGATAWRAWRAGPGPARFGWALMTASLLVWTGGGLANLWYEWVLGNVNSMYRTAMLAFHLAAVPLTFLLASEWRGDARRWLRSIDALQALVLGGVYAQITWQALTAGSGGPDAAGVTVMLWLFDAQNAFVALAALARWRAAQRPEERELLGVLLLHAWLYLGIAGWNNHFIAGNPAYGAEYGAVVTIAFALIWALALRPKAPAAAPPPSPPAWLTRAVRSASPLVLSGTLLALSLFLIRTDYVWGIVGVMVAVLGQAARSVATRVGHLAEGEALQREHSALQSMAWTDALTGVANRRFLDHALAGAWQREQGGSKASVAVLMMDLDHFKALNDRLGHPQGDECLRRVARALQRALVRPGDMLARYGGEEFIALLPDVDADGAHVVAERLRQAVQALQLPHPGHPQGVVTISVGLACAPLGPTGDTSRLMRAADAALYQAKRQGRNCTQRSSPEGLPPA